MRLRIADRSLTVACSSWSFACLSLDASIRILRALGFEHVDIGFAHLAIDGPDPPRRQGRRLKKRLGREGMRVCDLFPLLPFETNDPDGWRRESNARLFRRVVEIAEGCEAHGITLKPGIVQAGEIGGGWQLCVETLQEYAAIARAAGIRLSVEPHVDSIIEDPRVALLLARVSGIELTLDYSHFVSCGFAIEDVRELQAYARHVHVRQARKGKLQTTTRNGVIPIRAILEELVARGYRDAVSLEYQNSDWHDCNDVDVVAETVATLRELGAEA